MKSRQTLPMVTTVTAIALVTGGCGATPFYMGQQPTTGYGRSGEHMPETIREPIGSVRIVAGTDAPTLYVGGDYGTVTPTPGEGAAAGAGAGVEFTGDMVAEDPRALILVPLVLPIAVVAGTIAGAAAAKIAQEIQEFRDGLTEDMAGRTSETVPSAELAETLRQFVLRAPGVEPADEAPVSLAVTISDISVIVDGNDATLTTTADATLRDDETGSVLYTHTFGYSDRDTLRNWTDDDNALWDVYVENARQRIAREISEHFFETIITRHVLRPVRTASQAGSRNGNAWDSRLKDNTPTLAWELFLLGGDDYDAWALDESRARFDLEIYDGPRLVYAARSIDGMRHDVGEALPPCKMLSWTVRPIYDLDGRTRAGEWMYRHSATERMMKTQGVTFGGDNREIWEGYAKIRTRCTT